MKKIMEKSLDFCFFSVIFQALSLTFYTVVAFVAAIRSGDIERIDTFITENIVYSLLILATFFTAFSFKAKKRFSYTPFLLIQLFAIIIAWPLIQGETMITQVGGYVIGLIALAGLIIALLPQNRQKFL
jgi:hypothetical protein